MADSWQKELGVAVAAVLDAARVCQRVQAELAAAALEKHDRSPVTVADFASQALVCRALRTAFPHDAIIAEEDADDLTRPENARFTEQIVEFVRKAGVQAGAADVRRWIDLGDAADSTGRVWTLDPVDGTKGFLRGEQYAVALALIVDGRPRVAVLACPNLPLRPHEAPPVERGCLFGATEDDAAWVAAARYNPGQPDGRARAGAVLRIGRIGALRARPGGSHRGVARDPSASRATGQSGQVRRRRPRRGRHLSAAAHARGIRRAAGSATCPAGRWISRAARG